MTRPLSVLLTNKKRGWSGETAYIHELAVGCHAQGIPVTVAAREGSVLGDRLRSRGIPVHDMHFDPRSGRPRGWLRDVKILNGVVADRGVNVLHTHASWDTWIACFALRKRTDLVRVRTKHNVKQIRTHLANRWLYRSLIQWLIAPSANVEAHLRESDIVRKDRIRRIPYGIPLEPFLEAGRDRPGARARLAGELDVPAQDLGFVVAYISRVSSRKNPGALVDAARHLGPDAGMRVVFVGDGDLESLRERADGLDRVHVLGFRPDPETYHAAADAFVLPSSNEAFGLAAVEAMAAGTPVVLADRGGFREMIEDGKTGLFFRVDSAAEGIARALTRLRDDPDLRERLVPAAKAVAVDTFSAVVMVRRTLEFYRELTQKLLDTVPA